MVTKGLKKITQNETQDLQLVDNFCKSWASEPVSRYVQNIAVPNMIKYARKPHGDKGAKKNYSK